MSSFFYTGIDSQGLRVVGEISASSEQDAQKCLESRGLTVRTLRAAGLPAASSAELSRETGHLVTAAIADAIHLEIPLSESLRALSLEMPRKRARDALLEAARRLEGGESLETALAPAWKSLPSGWPSLLQSCHEHGCLSAVLTAYTEWQNEEHDLRREMWSALAYPVILILLFWGLFALQACFISPILFEFYDELFFVERPAWQITSAIRLTPIHALLPILPFAALGLLAGVARLTLGPVRWWQMIHGLPFLGEIVVWHRLSESLRLLSAVVRLQIPLSQALGIVAQGSQDMALRRAWKETANSTAKGQGLPDALRTENIFPHGLLSFVHAGERQGTLPEALRTASDLYRARASLRLMFVRNVLPPITFLFVAMGIIGIVASTLVPLVSLIQGLT